jgi:hypothetical protein
VESEETRKMSRILYGFSPCPSLVFLAAFVVGARFDAMWSFLGMITATCFLSTFGPLLGQRVVAEFRKQSKPIAFVVGATCVSMLPIAIMLPWAVVTLIIYLR